MNQTTINQLLALNADFYQQTAQSFSDSRAYFWSGWDQLLPIILQNTTQISTLKVLDLGCGNARFAEFLAKNIPSYQILRYYGWDNSADLLNHAQQKIANNILNDSQIDLHPQTSFVLDLIDLTQANSSKLLEQKSPFQIITLFGVLHHLPAQNNRLKILQTLAKQLQPQGLLIFSLWQFMKDPRLAARVIEPAVFPSPLQQTFLEENDYLLDWKRSATNNALRYCHNFTDQEISELVVSLQNTAQLKLIKQFTADGPQNNPLNTYLVFLKK